MAKGRVVSTRKGTCWVCERSIAMSRMGPHLKTHIPATGKGTHYIISVSGGAFWMFLQLPGNYTLKKIDTFLRQEWLECCGHLSQFEIDGVDYDVDPSSAEYSRPKSMNYKLSSVLKQGMVFAHEYDFGTTTELKLSVRAALVPPPVHLKGIVVLAVHDKVRFNCDVCGGDATKVCGYCSIYTHGSLLCDRCVKEHPCCVEDGEDALLDAVQSPRIGMCAYDSEPTSLDRHWSKHGRPGTQALYKK